MVLHQIEQSLGNFVLKQGNIEALNEGTLQDIHSREMDKGRVFNIASIKDVVEATYLDELFRFALDITKDTNFFDSINYLLALFHHLDIYEVRNAIAHPNRPFWDCYWYRIAAVASDPVNDFLELDHIKETLLQAEAGNLEEPPEDWVTKIIWQIPNNLPSNFDHGLTGLIGRAKEVRELKKSISNPRINTIALVAPGGAGKTALALDLLNEIISNPSYSKSIDGVLYTSMKTEKLTAQGIVPLDSVETLAELKNKIVECTNEIFEETFIDFSEVIEAYESKKILLCLDNLETLLRDNPDSFEELNQSLPPSWKVLITSRVVVANASIMSLELLKEGSAIQLARTYINRRGGMPLDEQIYAKVVESCYYNPLAIRLTLDLLIAGRELPESLSKANKEIAEFSYNNLIETLSLTAIEILEAIFVEDKSTRLSLCELLSSSLEEISEGINELTRTSLVSKTSTEGGETYSLSDSVRELLVVSPRNIDVRGKVQGQIHKRRVLSQEIDLKQEAQDLPVWHAFYIPKDTDENLKILITGANRQMGRLWKSTDHAVALYRKFRDAHIFYGNKSELYHRTYAKVLEALKDNNGAEEQLKIALQINPDDVCSRYSLARLCHRTKRYTESFEIYQSLIDDGWARDSHELLHFGNTIFNGYFLALLYSGEYNQIIEITKKWKDYGSYRGIWGTFRAGALKRKAELICDSDTQEAINCLVRATKILNDVFRNNGHLKTACSQAHKIFEEINFLISRKNYKEEYKQHWPELLEFVAKNIMETSSISNRDVNALVESFKQIEIPDNPFRDSMWKTYTQFEDSSSDIEIENQGYVGLIKVKITNRPKDRANYLFAKDAYGDDYFLHFDNVKDANWHKWINLSIGDKLNVVPESNADSSQKATDTREIYLSL